MSKALPTVLRISGGINLLAFGAVVMPQTWMEAAHAWLGLGVLPATPVVMFTMRQASFVYGMIGVALLILATNVQRFRRLIVAVGWSYIVASGAFLGIGIVTGVPYWWTLAESAACATLGGVILRGTPSRENASRKLRFPARLTPTHVKLEDRLTMDLGNDVRVALRRLRSKLAFTSVTIIVLGCGIGVSTALFNVINGGLFKADTHHVPGVVRFAVSTWSAACFCLLPPEAVEAVLTNPPQSLGRVVGSTQERSSTARIGGTPMVVDVESVSGPYFATFGVVPVAGRLLNEADDRAESAAAIVISEQLWRARLEADPAVLGSTAYVAGHPAVVVGVVEDSFHGFESLVATDVW